MAVYGRCNGRKHGLYTAVYTYTRQYTKLIEFATFSQIVVITSVNRAKHHIACPQTFIKYGVKRDPGRFFVF